MIVRVILCTLANSIVVATGAYFLWVDFTLLNQPNFSDFIEYLHRYVGAGNKQQLVYVTIGCTIYTFSGILGFLGTFVTRKDLVASLVLQLSIGIIGCAVMGLMLSDIVGNELFRIQINAVTYLAGPDNPTTSLGGIIFAIMLLLPGYPAILLATMIGHTVEFVTKR